MDGVRPIGVGEIVRRIMAKAVNKVLRIDIQLATGSLQTCAGIEGGIEATIHAMARAYNDDDSEGLLLVDADNAFNSLNRLTALQNIKSLCPPFYTFLNNAYKNPSKLYVANSSKVLLSSEGTTQGDPNAMDMYAISTCPIISHQHKEFSSDGTKQSWYADDASAVGKLVGLKRWWDSLCDIGPGYGYFPKPSKSILVVKEDHLQAAKEVFKDSGLEITSEGQRHLGAVVGTVEYRNTYVNGKVAAWIEDIKQLAEIAKEEPQIALTAYTKGLCRRWAYTQRTIDGISENFRPLEDVIRNVFIPAIVGRQISELERRLLALPVRHGGLGIQDPSQTSHYEYSASTKITEQLTSLIYNQNPSINDLNKDLIKKVKLDISTEKEERFQLELHSILEHVHPLTKKYIEATREKGASSWLTALPIKSLGFVLNKQEFRDALCLRYNWLISDIPKFCGCGAKNDIVHILSCKKGGYVSMRHNALRDSLANMMREGGCRDVKTEPTLLPVNPNDFSHRCNVEDGARLDISARGIQSTFECSYFDVRVSHPFATSNVTLSLPALYERNEKEKNNLYRDRVLENEKGSFIPLIFLTTGGMGPACTKTVKHLATMIANKKGEKYADVINFVRTKLRFALLRSALIAVKGVRGRSVQEPYLGNISFNLIPDMKFYDC